MSSLCLSLERWSMLGLGSISSPVPRSRLSNPKGKQKDKQRPKSARFGYSALVLRVRSWTLSFFYFLLPLSNWQLCAILVQTPNVDENEDTQAEGVGVGKRERAVLLRVWKDYYPKVLQLHTSSATKAKKDVWVWMTLFAVSAKVLCPKVRPVLSFGCQHKDDPFLALTLSGFVLDVNIELIDGCPLFPLWIPVRGFPSSFLYTHEECVAPSYHSLCLRRHARAISRLIAQTNQ